MVRFRLLPAGLLLWGLALSLFAADKRPLTQEDFDGWRSLDTPILSRDGRWLAYGDMPQVDDGFLVLHDLVSGREFRPAAGARPPAPFPPPRTNNPDDPPPPRQIRIALTSDSRFAVASTFPTRAEMVAARKAGKSPEAMPKNGLLLVNLVTGEAVRVPAVKSFQVPVRGGSWVAYLKEPVPESPDTAAKAKAAAERPGRLERTKTPSRPGKKPVIGSDLILRNLANGHERTFASVVEYSFTRDGDVLLFTVAAKAESANGVYAFTPGSSLKPVTLLAGPGQYLRLAWDRRQQQAAFLSDREDHAAATPRFQLYRWRRGDQAAVPVAVNPPPSLRLSDNLAPSFSWDGKMLYAGFAPLPPPERKAGGEDPEDKVNADLWRWADDYVQPMQEAQATPERNRTYLGRVELASGAFTQLADATLPGVTLSDDGRRALGYDDRAYRSRVDYDSYYSDVYLVDPATGSRRLVLREAHGSTYGGPSLGWSPDGKWAAWYEAGHWRALDTATGETRNLTAGLPVAFAREDHDMTEPPPSYGWAGWTSDSAAILVYDRYDAWPLFPDGRPARNLTQGSGRAAKTVLRVQDIAAREEDEETRGVDPAKPLFLRGESEETRASGFFRTSFDATAAPRRLLWGDYAYTFAGRATAANVLMVTASRFDQFPDIQTTDESFARLTKITNLGAQLEPFKWGRSELMTYRNADGVELPAMLVKPADFDPAKKYPLIVYPYERLSQIVHRFNPPVPGHNISFPFFASNGYLLLLPDIVYTPGHPGRSAVKCILPAVDALVARGYVDEKAIGIQGHSWGGYQIAFLITQTNRFRAAAAGSAVGNMTSAYGGIRWGAGLPRLFQYEQNQSRIGPPLTDAPDLYVENSPVFHVKNVQTPLLLLHNDQDEAVPWEQGIELFLALRRHGKQVWFFNYNQERHWLLRRADQQDYTRRLWQYFEHFLRGAPAPAWMEKGVPYLDRDEEKLRFNPPSQPATP